MSDLPSCMRGIMLRSLTLELLIQSLLMTLARPCWRPRRVQAISQDSQRVHCLLGLGRRRRGEIWQGRLGQSAAVRLGQGPRGRVDISRPVRPREAGRHVAVCSLPRNHAHSSNDIERPDLAMMQCFECLLRRSPRSNDEQMLPPSSSRERDLRLQPSLLQLPHQPIRIILLDGDKVEDAAR